MKLESEAGQDLFIINCLKGKQNGIFVEIGSAGYKHVNNTYVLETYFDWKGLMVEMDSQYLDEYKKYRPNSIHIIDDANKVDYKQIFINNQFPQNIDYLQIDLEIGNNSTLELLQKFDKEIFNHYKFATITFEHDLYRDPTKHTFNESRKIFEKRGYVRVFANVNDFEDWYVHPDLVDMNYIYYLIQKNKNNYSSPTSWRFLGRDPALHSDEMIICNSVIEYA
jgi:hypothetical protein